MGYCNSHNKAGEEAFKSITKTYYKGVACAVLAYDITKKESFVHIMTWLNDLKDNGSPGMLVILVGNKCDDEAKYNIIQEGSFKG